MDEPEIVTVADSKAALVRSIQSAARKVDEARTELRKTVEFARAAGCSWADVGRALHVSRQAAWERFTRDR